MKFRHSSFSLFFCGALLSLSLAALAGSSDDNFLAARDAVKAGDRAKLERLAPELQGYTLEPYVDYWRLQLDLSVAEPTTVRAFLTRYEASYLADKMRTAWLKQLGKKQQWADFDAEFPLLAQANPADQEVSCYALQSRRARGDATMLDDAQPLWMNLLEPPSACLPVLDALVDEKRVAADQAWERIRRQFETNRLTAARYTINFLPARQTPDAKLVQTISDAPLPWLTKLPADISNNRMLREFAALAVSRLARKDPAMAAERLRQIEAQLQPSEKSWAWGQIGWQAAQRHMPEAFGWYQRAGDAPFSDEVVQWKARAALRAQDWAAVRTTIEKMPPALTEQATWVYWLGRAYRAEKRSDDANKLFNRIAGQPNFYGNLADEELNRPITLPPKALPPTRDEVNRAEANAGLQRGLALIRVNLRGEGVKEWSWALRGMNDRDLLAAADFAQRAGVYDRAISAADRTQNEHDYSLRYAAPFADQIRPAAKTQSLDDAWVYGLMRQESRFITNAKSSAGASGLMQLMPATAKWVARKIGFKDYQHGQVNDTETNVLLGTSYMRMVMESLDNLPVLASAAYNAGPGRAQKWRADRALEGAIYAETIPFNETRDYVKKVMSNTTFYAALFSEKPQTIKARLGVIGPRGSRDTKAEQLP